MTQKQPTIETALPQSVDDPTLFDVEADALPVTLADKFIVGPFSVLDRRQGDWRQRKAKWLSLGIKSELGRAEGLVGATTGMVGTAYTGSTTSVFDPVQIGRASCRERVYVLV